MALPKIPQLLNRYYSTATTSTSGAPISTVVVAQRCKYLGGWYVPNQTVGTGTNGTGFDVLAYIGASSTTIPTAFVISSGVTVTTSTGTLAAPFAGQGGTTPFSTVAVYLNPGDSIQTVGSTLVGGFVTHVVGEF